MRERHGGDCRLIGFTTFAGTVTAGLFHDVDEKAFTLPISQAPLRAMQVLRSPLERTARWEEGEVPETFPYAV